ncbi:MAG: protein kinase [Candidatus Sericytochromatia bacterium]
MSLNNYEVIKQIGSGGMGTVFLARDPRLQRLVAIKKVKIPPATQQEARTEVTTRFYREARAIAMLNHPNIVTVYDLGEEDDSCYMVMEFLDGKDLESLVVDNGVLEQDFAVNVFAQACDALYYIHQRQLVHRDIKPANMIYCSNDTLKIMDFGLVMVDDNLHLTKAGVIMGSLLYMSPEQIQNPKNVDFKADMYALGISLYYSLCGNFPYYGENAFEVIRCVTLDEPVKVSHYLPSINKNLERIIMKMISKEKEDRYSNMQEIKQELLNYNKSNISMSNTIITKSDTPNIALDKTVIMEAKNKKNEKQETSHYLKHLLLSDELNEDIDSKVGSLQTRNYIKNNSVKNIINQRREDYLKTNTNNPKVSPNLLSIIKGEEISKNLEEIKNYNYPRKIHDFAPEDIKKLKEFNKNIVNEVDEIEKTIFYIENIRLKLEDELKIINQDLRDLQRRNPFSNLETQDKIDIKTGQKKSKEADLLVMKEKEQAYTLILNAKKLKNELNRRIIGTLSKPFINSFFDDYYNIFSLPEEIAELLKDFIDKKLDTLEFIINSIESINDSIFKMEQIQETLVDTASPYLKVINFLPEMGFIKASILKDLTNNPIIEIDITKYHTLFTYAYMTRDNRYIPKVKKGEDVVIKSEIFNNFDYDLKKNLNIYLAKFKNSK